MFSRNLMGNFGSQVMQKRALYTGIAMLGLTSLAAAWIHDRQGEGLGGLVEATAVTRQAIPQHTAGKSATAIQASQAGAAAAHGAAQP